jgi:hypothetical protein
VGLRGAAGPRPTLQAAAVVRGYARGCVRGNACALAVHPLSSVLGRTLHKGRGQLATSAGSSVDLGRPLLGGDDAP